MRSKLSTMAAAILAATVVAGAPAAAQKQGGTLKFYHRDNPPTTSIHEEATVSTVNPFMAVFNNLVLFDQAKPSNSLDTIELKDPQPSFLALLASGYTPIYPCHVSPRDMRTKPIGTGPFKFVEFKRNESVKLARNPDYWKKGRPYLDAIEVRIIASRSTRILAFVSGEFDMTYDTDVPIPLIKDVQSQAPKAICQLRPTGVYVNLLVNREAAPFNEAKLRRAMALALDRKGFDDILGEGKLGISGAMQPLPEG